MKCAPSPQPLTRRRQWVIAGGLFVIIFLVRAPTLFRSVLDWDESLYILMAEQWLAGHLPYTTIWDNKPIGIYTIFLIYQVIFGDNVAAIRLATAVFVTANAIFIFKISYHFLQAKTEPLRSKYAVFASVCYGIGSLSNDGLAANTEIFMTAFTTLAMLLAITPTPKVLRRNVLCGLIFGFAVMTKYVAIFEAPALAFALLYLNRPSTRSAYASRLLATAAGGIIPLLVTVLIYLQAGDIGIWWQDSVISNITRVAAAVPIPDINDVGINQLRNWLPFYVAPLVIIIQLMRGRLHEVRNFNALLFALLWLICGSFGVYAAKSFYDHYFLQILPALCLILTLNIAWLNRIGKWTISGLMLFPALAGWHALIQAATPIITVQGVHISIQPDTTQQVAQELNAVLQPQQHIYVFDDQPIIYSLTHEEPPTKYVFPSVLTTCFLSKVAKVDAAHEVHKILKQRPTYVVRTLYPASATNNRNYGVYQLVNQTLRDNYHLWHQVGSSQIFQLNAGTAFNLPSDDAVAPVCGHPV